MRRLPLILVALVLTCVTASAQAPSVTRMSIEQVIRLSNGLKALDAYELDGETAWAIARDLEGIQHMVNSYTSVREALITRYANGGVKVLDEHIAAFNADERKMLTQVVDIPFLHISRAALHLERNHVRPSVLVDLMPILD